MAETKESCLGPKPELKWINLTELCVPADYQRPANNSTSLGDINHIKTNFNWTSRGVIVCHVANSKPPQYAGSGKGKS